VNRKSRGDLFRAVGIIQIPWRPTAPMKRLLFITFLFGLVLALSQTLLALEAKDLQVLKRIEGSLERTDTELGRRERGERPNDEKFRERMDKKMADLKEDLAPLPADPEVEAARQKFQALSQRLQKLAQSGAQDAGAVDALLANPDYEGDREQIQAFNEALSIASRLDAQSPIFGNPIGRAHSQKYIDNLKALMDAQKQLDVLHQKWRPVLSSREGKARFIGQPLLSALKSQEKFQQAAEAFRQQAPALVESFLAAAEAGSKRVAQSKSLDQYEKEVARPMMAADDLYEALEAVGFQDASVAARVQQSKQRAAEQEKMASQVLIAANRGPADTYSGPDRAAVQNLVTQAWKGRYPQQKVLAVRLPHSWSRDEGWKWDTTSKSWKHFDQSSMQVSVMLEQSSTLVGWQTQWVHKYHLNGGRMGVQPFNLDKPTPRHQMLRSNM
jgi:hypothetical protein